MRRAALPDTAVAWCALIAAAAGWAATVGFGSPVDWYDEQRVAMLVIVALTVVFVPFLPAAGPPADPRIAVALLLSSGAGLVAALLSARPDAALLEWAALTSLAASSVLLGTRLESRSAPAAAAAFVSVLLGAYAIAVVARYVSAIAVGAPLDGEVLQAGLSNPRFAGQMLCLAIPLLPVASSASPRPSARAAVTAIAVVAWSSVIGSGSRTAWLALLAAAALALALRRRAAAREWFRHQALWAAGGAVLYWLAFSFLPGLFNYAVFVEQGRLTAIGSIEARLELWRFAWSDALQSSLVGIGPMHFAYAERGLGAHPHNFWLQLLAEWGVVVFVATAYALTRVLVSLWNRSREFAALDLQGVYVVSILFALCAWLVASQFDGVMVVPTSQVVSMVVLALAVNAVRRQDRPSNGVAFALASRVPAIALVTVAALSILTLPLSPLGSPSQRQAAWRAERPGQILWPRFWSQGWIGPTHDPRPCDVASDAARVPWRRLCVLGTERTTGLQPAHEKEPAA